MPGIRKTVLILGGTREAADLANRLAKRPDINTITSLAGRTAKPRSVAGNTRVGGFGGIDGLATYLSQNAIDLIVDATHPFAVEISANAAAAAKQAERPLLSLMRPPWQPVTGDNWTPVSTLESASRSLPVHARAFLALGQQHIAAFTARTDIHFVIRMIDPPDGTLKFRSVEYVTGRPGNAGQEETLLRSLAISHLVCRNSGGDASYPKLEAARRLSIPVVMIERPALPAGARYSTVDELARAIV